MNLREELVQIAAVAIANIQDIDSGSTELSSSDAWEQVFSDVMQERLAQEQKWGSQHHSHIEWAIILIEEIGEWAAEVVQEAGDDSKSYKRMMLDAYSMIFRLVDMEQPARNWLEERYGGDS